MKLSAIVQEAEYRQTVTGVQEAARDFDKMAASQKNAAAAGEVLVKQQDVAEKSITRLGSKLDAYTRQFDPMAKALRDVERGERLVAAARGQGLTVSDQTLAALESARQRYQKLSGGLNDNTKEVALNRAGWINLSRQLQDVGVSLYGGQSPLTVLAQQGGQIADVFTSSKGGAAAALGEFGAAVGRFVLNPLTLLVAGLGAAGAAYLKFDADQRQLEQSLNGVGRAAGVTAEQLRVIAQIGAARGGMTSGQGRDAASTFAASGLDASLIGGLTASSRQYAGAFGLDMNAATKELASVFTDPAKGVNELEKRLGVLDGTTKRYIEDLAAQGRLTEAQKALYDAFSGSLAKTTDATSALSRAWQDLWSWATRPIGALDDTLRKMRDGLSLREQLAKARGDYLYLNAQRKGDASSYPGESDALKRVNDLERQLQEQEQARIDAQRARDAAFMADKARPIVQANEPLIGNAQALKNSAELFKTVQDNDLALKQLGITREKAAGIAEKLVTKESLLTDEATKTREASDARTRSLGAYSETVKAAIDADQTYKETLRDTGDKQLAAAKADAIRAESMARVNAAIKQYNDAAKDQLALAGLSPYERARTQIGQEADKFKEQYGVVPSGVADKYAALKKQFNYDTFGSPMKDIEAQARMLDVQKAGLGKSTYEQAFDTAYMEKYNQLLKDNIEITPEAVDQMNQYAKAHADLAKASEEATKQQDMVKSSIEIVSSATKDLGSSLVDAFRHGENAGTALLGVLDRLTSKLLDKTLQAGVDALFSSGSKGGATGGIFGSLLSGVGHLFGFSGGGVMTSGGPLPLMRYEGGGVADRPQLAMFGEGRTPEAYVPLPDGRTIPVKMQGNGGVNVKVINNVAGAQPEVQRMSDGELLVVFSKIVDQKLKTDVPGILANSQRRGM
ncbi:MAG: phage tail length tape measure family protein [Methylocystis sp.]|uniref:phage tail length tape measure family protein n=1 Tax=Methylocystis sp. TaxID=1911079 RepID=UPI003DA6642E